MKSLTPFAAAIVLLIVCHRTPGDSIKWTHLSTANGDLEAPNSGDQQTASLVCDIDKDGINDFAIAERTHAPSLVWYRRTASGWTKHVVDDQPLHIEAGSDAFDIDGDGDLDVVFAGDWQNNLVWWWENPCPDFDPQKPWTRHTIKNFGGTKHHDLLFGDFDGDGREELVFWNQGARKLYFAEIPQKPREAEVWKCVEIYSWSEDSEMMQRQTRPYPSFKAVNEHEGLAKSDIDGDGKLDIVGGGRWFKHAGGRRPAYRRRSAGGRPRRRRRLGPPDDVPVAQRDLDPHRAGSRDRLRPLAGLAGLQRRQPSRHLGRRDAPQQRQSRRQKHPPAR